MIHLVTLDQQPLMRVGLDAALRDQPDLVALGAAADQRELWPLLYRSDPHVVLLGESEEMLTLCLRIKRRPLAPRVVLYADLDPAMMVASAVAGADGIAGRSQPMQELLATIRCVAAGRQVLPPVAPRAQAAAGARLEPADRPIFAMRLAGTAPAEIAATLGLGRSELSERTAAIVARLSRPAPPVELDRRRRRAQSTLKPPLTTSWAPVTNAASADAR
jgi:DNA-binding NarL/FixJ family response regulator